jgi:hypothetical protein
MNDNEIKEQAFNLLCAMKDLGDAAVNNDPCVKDFIEADAICVIDGEPAFHKDRFLEILMKRMFNES